jgi:hypothetical protein
MTAPPLASPAAPALAWRRFGLAFAAVATLAAAALYGFVLAIDPYGLHVRPGRPPGPIMDLNQRYMYPQIVRSGRYDSAVFGTSTVRLLDPKELGALFDGRFANLGLNAGTPWEQFELAALFLRHAREPKALVFGLDITWCEPDADRRRFTFRAFPPWLYDENPINDLPGLLSLKSVEIAGRVVLNRLGAMPPRIGPDGYELFVPPDAAYDLARARAHIYGWGSPDGMTDKSPQASEHSHIPMPALAWLDGLLGSAPASTRKILLFPPTHVAAQPPPGSPAEAIEAECKGRVAGIAQSRGASLLDFRRPSAVTVEDSNYWDPLHYRIGIARRIAAALRSADTGGPEPADGFYRVLSRPAADSPTR